MGPDFIINDFIWDYFELPITEDTADYYSIDEIKAEVENRIIILQKLGYNISKDNLIKYEIRDTTSITAGIAPKADNRYTFVISKLAARKQNEKYLDTIIYHELCHILQLEFLFNNNIFYYTDGKLKGKTEQKELIDQLYYYNNHHTTLWYSFVNKLNKTLLVSPPIAEKLEYKDLTDIFLESIYNNEFEINTSDLMDTFK